MGTNFLVGPVVVGNGGNGFKLKENRFKLGSFYKKSYVVKHWNRLPRQAVDSSSLKLSKARLDGAPSNLI